jgi:DNA-binding HxlR family transcriptional regulator
MKENQVKAEYLTWPIRQVISRFGDKWSLIVLYQLYKDSTGVMRFNELRAQMIDCSQKMLSQTLKNLEKNHLVNRKIYPVIPPKVEYSLTETGISLMPNIEGLIAWAKANFYNIVTD